MPIEPGPADDPDVDGYWLLADDDPHVLAHGRAPSASASPGGQPPDPAPAPLQSRPDSWAAVGSAFQPVPGGPLLVRGGADGTAATILVAPGTPVHSVHAGSVCEVVDGAAGRAVRRKDGVLVGYTGDAAIGWTCHPGDRVPAGRVLGLVTGPGPQSAGGRAVLHVTVERPEEGVVDAVRWLSNLPDPGELGVTATEDDIGVDPFLTDLRLAGHLPGQPPRP